MRKMRLEVAGLAALCSLLCAGGALAASSSSEQAQGNQIAKRVLAAFARIPAYSYREHGFMQMNSVTGHKPSLAYYYGSAALHPGFVWANESATVALSHNRVIWWRDDLTPTSNPNGHEVPVEIVANSDGIFYAFGNAAQHGCFGKLVGTVPLPYGAKGYAFGGRYVHAPNPLTYVYAWGGSGTARESDVIDSSSNLVTSGQVTVGGHSFGFANHFPGSAPAAPSVNLCR